MVQNKKSPCSCACLLEKMQGCIFFRQFEKFPTWTLVFSPCPLYQLEKLPHSNFQPKKKVVLLSSMPSRRWSTFCTDVKLFWTQYVLPHFFTRLIIFSVFVSLFFVNIQFFFRISLTSLALNHLLYVTPPTRPSCRPPHRHTGGQAGAATPSPRPRYTLGPWMEVVSLCVCFLSCLSFFCLSVPVSVSDSLCLCLSVCLFLSPLELSFSQIETSSYTQSDIARISHK